MSSRRRQPERTTSASSQMKARMTGGNGNPRERVAAAAAKRHAVKIWSLSSCKYMADERQDAQAPFWFWLFGTGVVMAHCSISVTVYY